MNKFIIKSFSFFWHNVFFIIIILLRHASLTSNIGWILDHATVHRAKAIYVCAAIKCLKALKKDKCGPSCRWRAPDPFYPCLNSKQFYLCNNNPIMTFWTYENEFICLYEGCEAVLVVRASGIRSPQVPINNHSPTWDGPYGHTVSFLCGLIYCGVITM